MLAAMTRRGWWVALRGVLVLTVEGIAITLGIMAIIFGVVVLEFGVLVLAAVVGFAAVVVTFVWPGLTALTVLYLIAAWAIITGFLLVAGAVRSRPVLANERRLVRGGFLAVAFGVFAILYPGASAIRILGLTGVYTVICGVLLLLPAFRLRGMAAIRTA